MTPIIKPIPNSALHNLTDAELKELIEEYRESMKIGNIDIKTCGKLVDSVFKVLGYRCALEYIEKYGD